MVEPANIDIDDLTEKFSGRDISILKRLISHGKKDASNYPKLEFFKEQPVYHDSVIMCIRVNEESKSAADAYSKFNNLHGEVRTFITDNGEEMKMMCPGRRFALWIEINSNEVILTSYNIKEEVIFDVYQTVANEIILQEIREATIIGLSSPEVLHSKQEPDTPVISVDLHQRFGFIFEMENMRSKKALINRRNFLTESNKMYDLKSNYGGLTRVIEGFIKAECNQELDEELRIQWNKVTYNDSLVKAIENVIRLLQVKNTELTGLKSSVPFESIERFDSGSEDLSTDHKRTEMRSRLNFNAEGGSSRFLGSLRNIANFTKHYTKVTKNVRNMSLSDIQESSPANGTEGTQEHLQPQFFSREFESKISPEVPDKGDSLHFRSLGAREGSLEDLEEMPEESSPLKKATTMEIEEAPQKPLMDRMREISIHNIEQLRSLYQKLLLECKVRMILENATDSTKLLYKEVKSHCKQLLTSHLGVAALPAHILLPSGVRGADVRTAPGPSFGRAFRRGSQTVHRVPVRGRNGQEVSAQTSL